MEEHKTHITTRAGETASGIPEPENIDELLETKQMRDAAIAHALAQGLPWAEVQKINEMSKEELEEKKQRTGKYAK
ncbi:MAG: hypothetical protein HZC14_00780 [Candidatus Niyogibacteria bacterium]|nr:hypothetical protein [Candidatus Niyogibacteria bacterium]